MQVRSGYTAEERPMLSHSVERLHHTYLSSDAHSTLSEAERWTAETIITLDDQMRSLRLARRKLLEGGRCFAGTFNGWL